MRDVLRRPAPARRVLALGLLAFFCAVAFLLVSPASHAQAKEWRIDNLDATLDVQPNGDLVVDETVTYYFSGSFSYVTRYIPVDNTEGITGVMVYDANGVPLPQGNDPGEFSVEEDGGQKVIVVYFDLTDTSATWTFHYLALGVVQFYDTGDEIWWHVFDATTPVAIGAARANGQAARGRAFGPDPAGLQDEQQRGAGRQLSGSLDAGVRGHRHPGLHRVLDRRRVPQGRGQVHVDGAPGGRLDRAQDRLRAPGAVLPGHAAHLAQAGPRRSLGHLCQVRQ